MSTTPTLDLVSIDYLRLATWDWQLYLELSAKMRRKFTGWRKSRWLQYTMERSQDGVSYGCATQQDKGHGVFESSGVDAHVFFFWLIDVLTDEQKDALYATRIDLQSTKVQHPDLDYVQVHKRIAKPKQLILGDDGNTLYIGNRESDSFWRIYDKTEEHTRCEVELKGNRAKGAWRFLVNNPNDLAQLYSGLLKKSRVPKFLVDYYQHAVQPTDLAQLKTELPEDMEKKLQWLTTLDSLVYKLANDHDMSDRTHVLIKRWYEYCSKP